MHQYEQKSVSRKHVNSLSKPTNNPMRLSDSQPSAVIQRARQNPRSVQHGGLAQLQNRIGNQAVCQLMRQIRTRSPKPVQMKENVTGMPAQLKEGVENLSGLSMDHVKVHYNSSAPEKLGAAAYTQGTDIHVGPGQEKHLPHEAWHVVQQAKGRVKPTLQMKAAAVNDDAVLEKEADQMGDQISHSHPTDVSQLKSVKGNFSNVKQLARLENANPLLANGRDLLEDAETLLAGNKRAGINSENLLDTTYDNMGDNLILDIDMLFEENLQREIEHDGFFTKSIKEIVEFIHKWNQIHSVNEDSVNQPKANLKHERIQYAEKFISEKTNSQVTNKQLKENGWDLAKTVQTNSNSSSQNSSSPDEETKRMVTGYVKLLKMLETQYPYFGGSEEYEHNERDKLEYWIYHMSSLTKDPDRQYKANVPESKLAKPLKDYRTHPEGKVPHQNQRNLGTGIVELNWDELPGSLNKLMTAALSNLYDSDAQKSDSLYVDPKSEDKDKRIQILENLFDKHSIKNDHRSVMLQYLWKKASEDEKKAIYGDVLKLPWSKAHIKKVRDLTPENVAGVMGNILETPKKARERYQEDLSKFEELPQALSIFKHDSTEDDLTKDKILNEFETKHQQWYENAKTNHKPIIGGISGHTLGYLNLYEEALRKAKTKAQSNSSVELKHPSMEVLRACMLGALVGDKRHHSYDEVMAASHNMPTHDSQQKLAYHYPDSYKDVLLSADGNIKNAATAAKDKTKQSVDSPESNTILHLLTNKVYEKEENKEQLGGLKESLNKYLDDDLSHHAASGIVESVNKLTRPAESRKLNPSMLSFFEAPKTSTPSQSSSEQRPGRISQDFLNRFENHTKK